MPYYVIPQNHTEGVPLGHDRRRSSHHIEHDHLLLPSVEIVSRKKVLASFSLFFLFYLSLFHCGSPLFGRGEDFFDRPRLDAF